VKRPTRSSPSDRLSEVDAAAANYVRTAARRLLSLLGERLAGVYVHGSLTLDGYVAGRSDIDLLAVCEGPLTKREKNAVADLLSHDRLPCPTRLEFFMLTREGARSLEGSLLYEINVDTGPDLHQVRLDPAQQPAHWFILDLAVCREHGIALHGPPPEEVIAPVPRAGIIEQLSATLDWYQRHEPLGHERVLNLCRAWRFAEEGVFCSKQDAAAWARQRGADAVLLDAALAMHRGAVGSELDRRAVDWLVERATRALGYSHRP
jgi:predicted nucleotidyltransferase